MNANEKQMVKVVAYSSVEDVAAWCDPAYTDLPYRGWAVSVDGRLVKAFDDEYEFSDVIAFAEQLSTELGCDVVVD
jgi:hypothetical protein